MVGALACLAPFVTATAQGLTGSVGGIAGSVRTRANVGTTTEVSSGALIGVEGHVGISRVSVDLSYLQGALTADTGSAPARDYVEGDAFLSVVTVPGVILRVGPHARAYVSSAGTQRWLFWTGHLRGEYTLMTSPAITAFAEGWLAWTAEVNVSEQFDNARGAVVGMSARIPGTGFYGRLSYGIEQARMGGGARLDTVEEISVVVGFGRR